MELKTLPLREAKPLLVPEGYRPFAECDDDSDELILWLTLSPKEDASK